MTVKTNSENETENFAANWVKKLKSGDVVALYGGLGAGKTAFVRGLARGLGYNGLVTSPTFSIVHEYDGGMPLFHFDLYRLSTQDELEEIGWYYYLEKNGITACEWSERAGDALPKHSRRVRLSTPEGEPECRVIEITEA